jgi:hypothetical protein
MLIQNFQIKKKIQIKIEDKELFDISNKFFQICELLKEYEVISINDITITKKILITDLSYKKKNSFCATTFVSDHN